MTSYKVRRVPRHEMRRVRGLEMHLTRWGPESAGAEPPLFLLHGFQDTGDTFQFIVDEFVQDRAMVAVDWRGFGRSEWSRDGYWFPDYLADLDALLDQLSPQVPARLVGHSMGGNIASLFAGVRPERVRCVVNLEGFGLARTKPEQAPGRFRKWLDQLKSAPSIKDYDSFEQLVTVIRFRYPRFPVAHAEFVAASWAKLDDGGRVRLLGDPRHRHVNPVLYKREDAQACWQAARAPMLMLLGEVSDLREKLGADTEPNAIRTNMPGIEIATISGAGHMMHIEKPELVAPLVEAFLNAH